jgi:hypothetical protein
MSAAPHNEMSEPTGSLALSLSIPTARTSEGSSRATFFSILVNYGDAKTWIVERRFSEFDELHDALENELSTRLPGLPPKTWFKSFDADFIEKRRIGLETYLHMCLQSNAISNSRTFLAFLDHDAAAHMSAPAANPTRAATSPASNTDHATVVANAEPVPPPRAVSHAQPTVPAVGQNARPRVENAAASAASASPAPPSGSSCLNGHELLARHVHGNTADGVCSMCHTRLDSGALASVCRRRCPLGQLACTVCRPLPADLAFASEQNTTSAANVVVAISNAGPPANRTLTRTDCALLYPSPSSTSLTEHTLNAILKLEFQFNGHHIAAQAATWRIDEQKCISWSVPQGEVIARAVYGDATPFGVNRPCWAFETDKGTVSPFWDGLGNELQGGAQQYDWIGNKFTVFEAPQRGEMSALMSVQRRLEEMLTARGETLHRDIEAHLSQISNKLNHEMAMAIAGIDESNHISNILTFAWWKRFCMQHAYTYLPVFASIALMILTCCATVYSLSKSSALAVILGVFLPAGFLASAAASRFELSGAHGQFLRALAPVCRVFALSVYPGILIGLLGAFLWLVPWWTLSHQGSLFNVNATSTEWLDANTAPTAGIYHFSSSTFVNQQFFGVRTLAVSSTSQKHFCAAPLMASAQQTRTVFWVTAIGCCNATLSTCWNAYAASGSVTGAYLTTRFAKSMQTELKLARTAASNKLAVNSSYSPDQLDALPVVYLELTADPEAIRDSFLTAGIIFTVVLTCFWPVLRLFLTLWTRFEICYPVMTYCQPFCSVLIGAFECFKQSCRCMRSDRLF